MQDNAGRCYWHLIVPVYLNMSGVRVWLMVVGRGYKSWVVGVGVGVGVLLYKQMKGYYLKDNDADVSSVGPSSEWIRGLWVVCVCMGGGGGKEPCYWWKSGDLDTNFFLSICVSCSYYHIMTCLKFLMWPVISRIPLWKWSLYISFSPSHFHPTLKMFLIPPRKLSLISYILPNPCWGFLGSIHQQRWYQNVQKTYVQVELQFLFISLTDQIINDHISRQRHFKSHR